MWELITLVRQESSHQYLYKYLSIFIGIHVFSPQPQETDARRIKGAASLEEMRHFFDNRLYRLAPPSAKTIPKVSLRVKVLPSLTHPYVRIMIVLTLLEN
jgi:hypothetical protein